MKCHKIVKNVLLKFLEPKGTHSSLGSFYSPKSNRIQFVDVAAIPEAETGECFSLLLEK